jgi:hypothetical protein
MLDDMCTVLGTSIATPGRPSDATVNLIDVVPQGIGMQDDERVADRSASDTAWVNPFIPTATRMIPNSASQQIPASANLGPGV